MLSTRGMPLSDMIYPHFNKRITVEIFLIFYLRITFIYIILPTCCFVQANRVAPKPKGSEEFRRFIHIL